MKEAFPDHQQSIVKDVKYKDLFGRVSFFHVCVGGKQIPLFQPATIMFRSAIKSFSDLAIKVMVGGKEVQRNSMVLDSDGALFLAKFALSLKDNYTKEAEKA